MVYIKGNVERIATTAIDMAKLESEGFRPLAKKQKPKPAVVFPWENQAEVHPQDTAVRRGRKKKEG